MKITLTTLAFAMLVSPLFAGNDNNATYLALGDSVAFGFNPLLLPPFADPIPKPTPNQFVGYPEVVAALENLTQFNKEVNASCPGETSGSFLDVAMPDNGCNSPHLSPPADPFKTSIGLHTQYTGAQMDFATTQLHNNKHINLVTLSIGANDVLLVLPQLAACGTDLACANGVLGPVLKAYGQHLGLILHGIRAEYQGTLVLVKYYAPSPALDNIALELNQVMTTVGATFRNVKLADGYTAFRLASAPPDHDACKAGLVIKLSSSPLTCDIHPTPWGRNLLAATVAIAQFSR